MRQSRYLRNHARLGTCLRGSACALGLAVLASATPVAAESFTIIDVPGAQLTETFSINDKGQVTGWYNADLVTHGYVRAADGTITTFDPPDSGSTAPVAIDGKGAITGNYCEGECDGGIYGFLREPNGTIITIDAFASGDTYPTAISNGVITGYYGNHGFIRSADGTLTSFDPSGSAITEPAAINEKGDITGFFIDTSNVTHGFLRLADGTITTFDVKLACYPEPSGINREDAIIGVCETGSFERFRDGRIKTFDVVNGQGSVAAFAINAKGTITGLYGGQNSLGSHGFVGSLKSGFTSFDPPNATTTRPLSINDKGDVAGYFFVGSNGDHGFIRTP